MGRIKSTLIKKTARQIMEKDISFNQNFEHNKQILGNTLPSKKIRNKVAGYITRLVKTKTA